MGTPRFTWAQKLRVADEFPKTANLDTLATELGVSVADLKSLGWRLGLKRDFYFKPGKWVLIMGEQEIEEEFVAVSNPLNKDCDAAKNARKIIKSNIVPGLNYKLYITIPSKANTKKMLTAKELKQEVGELLAKMDSNNINSVAAYAKMSRLIDDLAGPQDIYTPSASHTKHDSLCFQKAKDDEPIFVIRGQDLTGPATVMHWVELNVGNPMMSDLKLQEAFDTAMAMRNYGGRKNAD